MQEQVCRRVLAAVRRTRWHTCLTVIRFLHGPSACARDIQKENHKQMAGNDQLFVYSIGHEEVAKGVLSINISTQMCHIYEKNTTYQSNLLGNVNWPKIVTCPLTSSWMNLETNQRLHIQIDCGYLLVYNWYILERLNNIFNTSNFVSCYANSQHKNGVTWFLY